MPVVKRGKFLVSVWTLAAVAMLSGPVWAQVEGADVGDCAGDQALDQAVVEGARKIGAAGSKLLGRIGIPTTAPATSAPAARPCQPRVAGAAPTPTATQPAAAPAPRFKLGGGAGSKGQRNCGALGAGCADGMSPLVACMAEKDGYLWKALADAIEQKRDQGAAFSAEQLGDLAADVAALREAHRAGAPRVAPVDPARPERYNSWLTSEEYSATASYAMQSIESNRQACNARHARF
jgi:hypothetical protein